MRICGDLDLKALRFRWQGVTGRSAARSHLPKHLLFAMLAYRIQADAFGDLDAGMVQILKAAVGSGGSAAITKLTDKLDQRNQELPPGAILTREWNGRDHRVMVLADGFAFEGKTYDSLSKVAFAITGTKWNGPRFFGLRAAPQLQAAYMTSAGKSVRCAIYTRVSTDAGLDQEFNSLDAQYDASEAYIRSQAHAGWTLIKTRYDDGGFSGGSTDRPALQKLARRCQGPQDQCHCRL